MGHIVNNLGLLNVQKNIILPQYWPQSHKSEMDLLLSINIFDKNLWSISQLLEAWWPIEWIFYFYICLNIPWYSWKANSALIMRKIFDQNQALMLCTWTDTENTYNHETNNVLGYSMEWELTLMAHKLMWLAYPICLYVE